MDSAHKDASRSGHPQVVLRCNPFSITNHRLGTKAAAGCCSWIEHCAAVPIVSAEVTYVDGGRTVSFGLCPEHHLRVHEYFEVVQPQPIDEVVEVLGQLATGFAGACRADPSHAKDAGRLGTLALGRRGVHADEASAFLRTFRRGLVDLEADGSFTLSQCRACPPALHLIGRNEDHTALHTEYLIHLGVVAELVDDHGWHMHDLAFEQGEWDLHGYEQDRITLAVEAKARADRSDPDSLESLRDSLFALSNDPAAEVKMNHRRKWTALYAFVQHGPVRVLLVADGARWWLAAHLDGDKRLRVTPDGGQR